MSSTVAFGPLPLPPPPNDVEAAEAASPFCVIKSSSAMAIFRPPLGLGSTLHTLCGHMTYIHTPPGPNEAGKSTTL